jgi:uncharacterized protein YabN with tetrapyrrole methylase and pyrophosphatase domain
MDGANLIAEPQGVQTLYMVPGALMQAHQLINEKATVHKKWENEWHGWEQLGRDAEECQHLAADIYVSKHRLKLEMGKLLFTLVKICNCYGINSEESLMDALQQLKPDLA